MNLRSVTLTFAFFVASARAAVAGPPADVGISSADEPSALAPETPGETALDAFDEPRGVPSASGGGALPVKAPGETAVAPSFLLSSALDQDPDAGVPSAGAPAPKTPGETALDALTDPRGVPSSSGSRALSVVEPPVDPEALWAEQCSSAVGYIDCDDGFVRGSGRTKTCAQECADQGVDCCYDPGCPTNEGTPSHHWPCFEFTGKICKSGKSCSGYNACGKAKIDYIVGSCVGTSVCSGIGYGRTTLDTQKHLISNSCLGNMACNGVGGTEGHFHPTQGNPTPSCCANQDGSWKSIINSCKKELTDTSETPTNMYYERQCRLVGGNGGRVGDIINSCTGIRTCHYVGASGGLAGDIINSCHYPNQPPTPTVSERGVCSVYPGSDIMPDSTAANYFQNGVKDCCTAPNLCNLDTIGTEPLSATCIPDDPSSEAGPWEITHLRLSTNFNASSEEEISTDYLIGKDRQAEAFLFQKDCQTNITDISINTTKVVANRNSTHDLLRVNLSVDKSAIGNSSAYNKTSNEFEVCQVIGLVLPASESGGNGALTIAEHVLQIAVAFDLSANFNFTAGLEAGEIFNETEEVDAAAAVDAFKCDEFFNPNSNKLGPNDRMFTCVGSKDPAFEVDEVDRMTISQTDKQDLEVIAGGDIQIPSITTVAYTSKGAIVGSRIPINLFDFADGEFLKITGAVTMKLADGTSRRLNVELGSAVRDLQDETNEASYAVDVALQAVEESTIDLSNSAAGVAAAALEGFAIAALFLLL